MSSSGPVPRGIAPDGAPNTSPLDEVVHAMSARMLAFEFAHDAPVSALDRAVLRCARDLRELLLRTAADVRPARTPAVRALDHELARGVATAFAWVTERLDSFVAAQRPRAEAFAPTKLAWYNVPRAVDDEVLALVDLCAVAEAEGADTAALATTLRRMRGAMHRLSLLTTTVV